MTAIEQLPDYMKVCFKALYDMTNEISCKVNQKHGWNPLYSLRKAVRTNQLQLVMKITSKRDRVNFNRLFMLQCSGGVCAMHF